MKKTILHITHDLGRGGAETILVTTLKELTAYNNVVITFNNLNEFGNQFVCDKYICLNIKHPLLFPFYFFKLRKIIRQQKADMVHSRLFWATMLARIAVPKTIPLITTIHAYISTSLEYKKWYIKWLDKFTYQFHKTIMLADSDGALKDYFSFLHLKPFKAISPFTFVDTKLFKMGEEKKYGTKSTIRLISVGRIAKQKNHAYLINAFKLIKDKNFELHIYGGKLLDEEIEKEIKKENLNVELKGLVTNIQELIPQYDIFVMSSLYEGFSLAVLEAMAMGMPLLLSNIESFKEQCGDTAIYFDLDSPKDFVEKLIKLSKDETEMKRMGNAAKERVLKYYTLEHHMKIINQVYEDVMIE